MSVFVHIGKSNKWSLFSFSYCVKNCFNTSAHKWRKKVSRKSFHQFIQDFESSPGKKTARLWSVIIWLGGFFHVLSTRLSTLWRSKTWDMCKQIFVHLLLTCFLPFAVFWTIFVNVYLLPPIPNILKQSPCSPQSKALRGHRLHFLVQTRLLTHIRSRQR